MDDRLGAFCNGRWVSVPGAANGPLYGLNFAAKDVFDIAGYRTGAGNPDWLKTHPPAASTASAIQRLLDAGATLAGKTQTDELTFSLNGENHHYGTPANPNAPGRIPGGSSSGSACAVAGSLVDFALGTDTGGSIRLPANNCGIYGFRPTHGSIPNDGVVPLAPSFDTIGWFARDAAMLERVGLALLSSASRIFSKPRLLIAEDAFELVFSDVRPALGPAVAAIASALGDPEPVHVYDGDAEAWMSAFRVLQGTEVWQCHGDWIRKTNPEMGPEIRDRFEWAASIDRAKVPAAKWVRARVTQKLDKLLGKNAVLCIPTSPSIALLKNSSGNKLEAFRSRALSLLCIAGLSGQPQVSLPLATSDGCPLGVSLIGPRGSDLSLLALAGSIRYHKKSV